MDPGAVSPPLNAHAQPARNSSGYMLELVLNTASPLHKVGVPILSKSHLAQGFRVNSLWLDFLTNEQKLIHKWKHFFPIYEQHFSRFVNRDVTLIEIGVSEGGSLQMWKRYLGPHARIIGIDINPRCVDVTEDQIEIRIGDQSDPVFLAKIVEEFDAPDIVIDDGSHVMSHIKGSFLFLYPKVARNGIYLVEDLHTAYWEEYEGGLRKVGTFIELCKDLIDELNADHTRGALAPSDFSASTLSMHFYDSVVVFEKGRHTLKHAPQFGKRRIR